MTSEQRLPKTGPLPRPEIPDEDREVLGRLRLELGSSRLGLALNDDEEAEDRRDDGQRDLAPALPHPRPHGALPAGLLAGLLADQRLNSSLGKAARQRAEDQFSVRRQATCLLDLWARVLEDNSRG